MNITCHFDLIKKVLFFSCTHLTHMMYANDCWFSIVNPQKIKSNTKRLCSIRSDFDDQLHNYLQTKKSLFYYYNAMILCKAEVKLLSCFHQ